MTTAYLNQAHQIIVDTPTKITGLTDVVFTVFNTSGVAVAGSPFSATEIGSSGTYTAAWTPLATGDYIVEVASVSQGVSEVSSAIHVLQNSTDNLATQIVGLNDLSATDVWTSANRTLTAFNLPTSDIDAIATAVETAILNEGDGNAVINAIVTAIGNTNLDQVAVVAAIRSDMERAGGLLDVMDGKLDNITTQLSTAGQPKFRVL